MAGSAVVESPTALIEFPLTVIGALARTGSRRPPRRLLSPEVDGWLPVAAGAVVLVDVPALLEVESPSTLMPLPLTVIGALTLTGATRPPSTLLSPLVVAGCPVLAEPALVGAGAVVAQPVLVEPPATLTAFPDTVTGTLTVAPTASPEAMPLLPEVLATGADVAGDVEVDVVGVLVEAPLVVASPRPPIALPTSEIGALRLMPSTSPEAAPSFPLVVGSAALAAPIPASDRPPRMTVNHSPLDTILFMM